MERVEMTCACGATFKVESNMSSVVKDRMEEWMEIHKGHQAPPLGMKPPSIDTRDWGTGVLP